MPNTYIYHTDPGHGWVAVKRQELIELGILDKISSYSYQRGDTVYLEEDSDAAAFVIAYQLRHGCKPLFRDSYQEHNPIRAYARFSI